MLKFCDLYSGTSDSIINMYEMLTPYAHKLRLAAKRSAIASGHKFVWVRDDTVMVRKDEGSEIINLVTESDLELLS